MKNKSLKFALAFVALAPVAATYAVEETGSIAVSAEVAASCTLSTSALAFGSYTATADLDATTNLDLTCSSGTTYDIALDAGAGGTATTASREMTDGTNILNYALYNDSGRSQTWGTSSGVDTVGGTGTGSVETITVYGRVPQGQYQPVGSYTDTVNVTVTY